MIGVFDSGVGGLFTVAALRQRLPRIDILYFGDTARMPYGEKSDREIVACATHAADLLLANGADRLIAACGTVSSVALPTLRSVLGVRIDGVTEAAADEASDGQRIAVLGTDATVRSAAFTKLLRKYAPHAEVRSLACPLFVKMAENGETSAEDPRVMRAVREALTPLSHFHPDRVILGCTHFPLLTDAIRRVFPDARLIGCGDAAAARIARELPDVGNGTTRILVSGDAHSFHKTALRFFGNGVAVPTVEADSLREIIRNIKEM